MTVDFLVMDRLSAYNVIVGRPTLNKLRPIASTHHWKMKFPTDNGVGEFKGDEMAVKRCYNTTLKEPIRNESLSVRVGCETRRYCKIENWSKN